MLKMTSRTHRTKPLRIGCASGFWGDSEAGATQLLVQGDKALAQMLLDLPIEVPVALLESVV